MRCIYCNNDDSRVVDSRPVDNGMSIRRRRECIKCGKRFTTYERIDELPFVVVKKDGTRQTFSQEKIAAGIRRACDKRPIPIAEQNMLADRVVRELFTTVDEDEIPSKLIGEVVMRHLRDLDEVAYVRFASVYRQFRDLNTFMDELKTMLEEKDNAKHP